MEQIVALLQQIPATEWVAQQTDPQLISHPKSRLTAYVFNDNNSGALTVSISHDIWPGKIISSSHPKLVEWIYGILGNIGVPNSPAQKLELAIGLNGKRCEFDSPR